LQAAADRLLAGTPLRSTTTRLTTTELITEAGLRRDTVYADHRALVDDFQARVRAQTFTPDNLVGIIAKRHSLKIQLAETTERLRQERDTTAIVRRAVAELSIELHQATAQNTDHNAVTQLSKRAPQARRQRQGDRHSPTTA
jgi:hypothetical protein